MSNVEVRPIGRSRVALSLYMNTTPIQVFGFNAVPFCFRKNANLPKSNTKILKPNTGSRLDLTEGPIFKTLVKLAVPVTISMVLFTVYLLVDLYFVGRLGPDAVAALSIASNAFFIHLGFSTILGTGGMALIAQAFGRREYDHAARVFKQSLLMALVIGIIEAVTGFLLAPAYIEFFGGTGKSLRWGIEYFQIFSIGFVMVGTIMMASSAFQGLGKTYPSLVGAVVDNALFAGLVFTLPVYFSWGIQAVWWIKLATAAVETVVVAVWLKQELANVRSSFNIVHRPAGLSYS